MTPFALEPVAEHEVQRTSPAPGEIVPPDGSLVQVSALVDGIAPADKNRNAPSVGEPVREGQILVVLAPRLRRAALRRHVAELNGWRGKSNVVSGLSRPGRFPGRASKKPGMTWRSHAPNWTLWVVARMGDYSLSLRAPISG